MPSISEINSLSPEAFINLLGGIFEHSPWVAESAEKLRPFSDLEALHDAMTGVVAGSPAERQLALIQAHPDLAGRLAKQGQLTAESTREQASAGLTSADSVTLDRIGELNTTYRAMFGFPFIICARLNKVDRIVEAMETRLLHTPDEEISAALAEIGKITLLRLKDLIDT